MGHAQYPSYLSVKAKPSAFLSGSLCRNFVSGTLRHSIKNFDRIQMRILSRIPMRIPMRILIRIPMRIPIRIPIRISDENSGIILGAYSLLT